MAIKDLRGRKFLVTGAASGIGRALALAAAAEGAELVLTDLAADGLDDTVRTVREGGGSVLHAAALDISDYDAVTAFAADVHDRAGALDVVANVAGTSVWGTVDALEHRHWKQMVDVNLMGPIHVIENFVPPMIEAGRGGHLVNVSSAAGLLACRGTRRTARASSACAGSPRCCASTCTGTASGSRSSCPAPCVPRW